MAPWLYNRLPGCQQDRLAGCKQSYARGDLLEPRGQLHFSEPLFRERISFSAMLVMYPPVTCLPHSAIMGTGLPVRSAVLKPCAGRLVVWWVTSEYLLLNVFAIFGDLTVGKL
jgi:hypothetical protein